MRKRGISFFLIVLFFVPFIFAQEESNTYSGFNRFTDNIKLFFSSGENKINLALEIREKEVNSALDDFERNKEITDNLERARNKLLIVQKKVITNNAEKVKNNINELMTKINNYENLSEEFETYLLEEEKTQLTAKLIIEIDGKEGQTLTREVVKDGTTGKNIIKIVVVDDEGKEIITETQGQIGQLQNKIAERIIKIDIAGEIDKANLENGIYIAKGGEIGDDGLKPEVKTDIAGNGTGESGVFIEGGEMQVVTGGAKNDPLPEPDLNQINPDLYNSNSVENVIDETYDDDNPTYAEGTTAEGNPGVTGTNNVDPAVDSNEGDLEMSITGDIVSSNLEDSWFETFFKRLFKI